MTHCVCLVCRTTNLWVGDVVAGKEATTFRFGVWATLPTVGEAEGARPTDASARPRSWNSTTRNKMSSKLRFYLLALQINVQGKVLEISVGKIFINVIIAFLLFMHNEFQKSTLQVQGLLFWPWYSINSSVSSKEKDRLCRRIPQVLERSILGG